MSSSTKENDPQKPLLEEKKIDQDSKQQLAEKMKQFEEIITHLNKDNLVEYKKIVTSLQEYKKTVASLLEAKDYQTAVEGIKNVMEDILRPQLWKILNDEKNRQDKINEKKDGKKIDLQLIFREKVYEKAYEVLILLTRYFFIQYYLRLNNPCGA